MFSSPYLNSEQHISVIELCREKKKHVYGYIENLLSVL